MLNRIAAMLLGAMCGVLPGVAFGVAIGVLLAPTVNPRHPLEHEWYMMAAFGYVFWSVVGGAALGLIVGAFLTRETIGCTSAGLLLGLLAGYIVWDNGLTIGSSDLHRSYGGLTIVWFTFGTAILGAIAGGIWSMARRASQPVSLP